MEEYHGDRNRAYILGTRLTHTWAQDLLVGIMGINIDTNRVD